MFGVQVFQIENVFNCTTIPQCKERLNFISEQQTYFIIVSMLKEYFHFGHRDKFLFPKFQLGNSYNFCYPY